MKFKKDAIKPGMVIFCRQEEDEQELLKHLKSQGYATDGVPIFENSYICPWEDKDSKNIGWSGCEDESIVVNFSDLIEPDDLPTDSPMSAAEVLEWLIDHCGGCCDSAYEDAFGEDYSLDELFFGKPHEGPVLSPQEVVEKIEQYEATRKAQKPVEVEEGYYCKVYTETETVAEFTDFGIAKALARERARKIAIKHAEEWNEPTFADVHFVCRIKEE